MKQTFKVFKLEDGKYFEGFSNMGIVESDNLVSAFWINGSDDNNEDYIDQIKKLKGEFVDIILSDEEDFSNKTIKIQVHAISSQKLLKKIKSKIKYIEDTNMMATLKLIKIERGYTEQKMAYEIGVGKSTVHDWLNGKKPSKKYQSKIDKFLNKEL